MTISRPENLTETAIIYVPNKLASVDATPPASTYPFI
jgi:hypothetical protein